MFLFALGTVVGLTTRHFYPSVQSWFLAKLKELF